MIAALALLIPPLVLVCLRQRVLGQQKPWQQQIVPYLIAALALNGVVLFVANLLRMGDNPIARLNDSGLFACKYMALSVALALMEPYCESFLLRAASSGWSRNDNAEMPGVGGRKVYIDFLRIIAIYMVLFNHTETNGFMLFTEARESALYWFYLFNSIFIKVAVPLFYMVSGALLLNRDEPIRKILKDRVLKYAIVLLVSSLLAYVYSCLRKFPRDMSLDVFLKAFFTSELSVALWYLYAYLAFLLMLPFLRKMARGMTNKEFMWLLMMYTVINLLGIIDFLLWKGEARFNGRFSFFINTAYVFYPLMGYFLEHRLEEKDYNAKTLAELTALSIVSIGICCVMTHYRSTLLDAWNEGNSQTFFNTLIFVPAITVYYAAKMWFMHHRIGERAKHVLSVLGDCTFGLFLIEYLCRFETMPIFNSLRPIIHPLPACWVWIAAACALGVAITYFVKKIPGVNKFI